MARSAHRLLLSRVGMGSSEAGRSRGLPAPGLGRRGGVLPVRLPNSRGTADSAHECFVPLCLALSSVTSPCVDVAGAGRAAGGGAGPVHRPAGAPGLERRCPLSTPDSRVPEKPSGPGNTSTPHGRAPSRALPAGPDAQLPAQVSLRTPTLAGSMFP